MKKKEDRQDERKWKQTLTAKLYFHYQTAIFDFFIASKCTNSGKLPSDTDCLHALHTQVGGAAEWRSIQAGNFANYSIKAKQYQAINCVNSILKNLWVVRILYYTCLETIFALFLFKNKDKEQLTVKGMIRLKKFRWHHKKRISSIRKQFGSRRSCRGVHFVVFQTQNIIRIFFKQTSVSIDASL